MINNPSEEPNSQNTIVAKAIWAALQTQTSNNAKNFITKMAKEETVKALEAGADILEFAVGVCLLVFSWRGCFACSSNEVYSVVNSYQKVQEKRKVTLLGLLVWWFF